jgi:transcriptional antiterminator NusG
MAGNPPEEGIGLLSGPPTTSSAVVKGPAAAAVPEAVHVAPTPVIKAAPAGLLSLKAADDVERFVTAGTVTTLSAVLTSAHHEPGLATIAVEVAYTSKYPGEGAEWPVSWMPPGKRSFLSIHAAKTRSGVTLTPGVGVAITFEVTAPVGIRFGDRLEIRIHASWEEGGNGAKLTLACVGRQAVLAIKTSRGYEREVADTLLTRAEEKPDVVFALLVPAALRGYVFAEGMSSEGVRELLKGIRKARGLVDGETTLKEVEPLLVPRVTVEGFVEGAIVELIAGPFKGEKARVKKIDQGKEEITVELIEAVVPIPVTVRGDHVRMLEKGGGKSGG